jgi:hypothetical protein
VLEWWSAGGLENPVLQPLGTRCLRVPGIWAIVHHQAHELGRVFMDNTGPADNDKVPGSLNKVHLATQLRSTAFRPQKLKVQASARTC